ncbi:MAG: ABC transporter ATP-binding protein [Deferrisomatales bacterium]|nr:ABC transporter ATP-binding protein [Deferrisomatales bacterium]
MAVEIVDAAREFAPGRGVRGISLTLGGGRCVAVLGRNGSGKTTLTRLLLGLERPDRGTVRVLGAEVGAGSRAHLGRVGACLERAAHWDGLSGWDNAYFWARARGLGHRAAEAGVGSWFERAGLRAQAREPVGHWSYGMRRKLALVQALCPDPELLVLDEPTAGVDTAFADVLAGEIRARSAAGRSTWVAGNDPSWVEGVAHRVVLLQGGEAVAEGRVAELVDRASPLREVTVTLAREVPISPPSAPWAKDFFQEGCVLWGRVDADPAWVPALLAHVVRCGGEVRGLEVRRAGLREALVRLAGGEGP